MKPSFVRFMVVLVVMSGLQVMAQTPNTTEQQKGITGIETFQGTLNTADKVFKLDSNIGYDFNQHFGMFAGIPVYFSNASATTSSTGIGTTSTNAGTNSGIGNLYLGLALRAPNPALNYASTITAGAPTGSRKVGLSTGRANVEWSNHFDHSFDKFTPFLDAGLGNGVFDTARVTHPFTSLGATGQFEEGAEYEMVHHFAVGGSGYHDVPFGNQKVYSKLLKQGQIKSGGPRAHSGVFENSAFASGNGLTRENGVNTWVAFEPNPFWRAQVGYSRSVTFALNSFEFNLGLNVGKMLRSNKGQ